MHSCTVNVHHSASCKIYPILSQSLGNGVCIDQLYIWLSFMMTVICSQRCSSTPLLAICVQGPETPGVCCLLHTQHSSFPIPHTPFLLGALTKRGKIVKTAFVFINTGSAISLVRTGTSLLTSHMNVRDIWSMDTYVRDILCIYICMWETSYVCIRMWGISYVCVCMWGTSYVCVRMWGTYYVCVLCIYTYVKDMYMRNTVWF